MVLLSHFLPFIIHHVIIISFFGSLLIGEELLVLLAILSGHWSIHLWVIFIFGFLGSLAGDFIWYAVGKSKLVDYLKKIKFFSESYKQSKPLLKKLGIHNMKKWWGLAYFVILSGAIKALAVVYISRKGVSLKRFLSWDIPCLLVWLSLTLTAGWLAGRGFTVMLTILHNFQLSVFILVIGVFIFYLFIRKFINWLLKIKR